MEVGNEKPRAPEDVALENEAVTLMRQYGLFLPGPPKAFFRKLAAHMNWTNLQKAL